MSLKEQGPVPASSSCNLGRGLWWTPATHWLYGPEPRGLVNLLFHVANRGPVEQPSQGVKMTSASWWPPQEIWNLIASYCVHSREYCPDSFLSLFFFFFSLSLSTRGCSIPPNARAPTPTTLFTAMTDVGTHTLSTLYLHPAPLRICNTPGPLTPGNSVFGSLFAACV